MLTVLTLGGGAVKNGSLIVMTCQFDIMYADHYTGPYRKLGTLPMRAMTRRGPIRPPER